MHVLGVTQHARFSAQTGVLYRLLYRCLYLLDLRERGQAGRSLRATPPLHVNLESLEALVPFHDSSGSQHPLWVARNTTRTDSQRRSCKFKAFLN
jgi:hypothetical protein